MKGIHPSMHCVIVCTHPSMHCFIVIKILKITGFFFQVAQEELEREIRRRIQLQTSNDLAIECRRRQKEKELEEEENWRAKMLIEMEKVRLI